MIKQVVHEVTGPVVPAGVTLALAVAYELHAPQTETQTQSTVRAPEVAIPQPQLMGLRTSSARPHRRKVPLKRLTLAMC
ncbi:hypothetical protein ABT009_35740 [Streptomyces sp. NPDC002896]|uniref:hypothetical protein n=1 Tax=Streptomyces sp. NPDC002896 TaxID=3154438 RepID=UPI00332B1B30